MAGQFFMHDLIQNKCHVREILSEQFLSRTSSFVVETQQMVERDMVKSLDRFLKENVTPKCHECQHRQNRFEESFSRVETREKVITLTASCELHRCPKDLEYVWGGKFYTGGGSAAGVGDVIGFKAIKQQTSEAELRELASTIKKTEIKDEDLNLW